MIDGEPTPTPDHHDPPAPAPTPDHHDQPAPVPDRPVSRELTPKEQAVHAAITEAEDEYNKSMWMQTPERGWGARIKNWARNVFNISTGVGMPATEGMKTVITGADAMRTAGEIGGAGLRTATEGLTKTGMEMAGAGFAAGGIAAATQLLTDSWRVLWKKEGSAHLAARHMAKDGFLQMKGWVKDAALGNRAHIEQLAHLAKLKAQNIRIPRIDKWMAERMLISSTFARQQKDRIRALLPEDVWNRKVKLADKEYFDNVDNASNFAVSLVAETHTPREIAELNERLGGELQNEERKAVVNTALRRTAVTGLQSFTMAGLFSGATGLLKAVNIPVSDIARRVSDNVAKTFGTLGSAAVKTTQDISTGIGQSLGTWATETGKIGTALGTTTGGGITPHLKQMVPV